MEYWASLGMEVHRGTRGYTVIHGKSLSEQPNTRGYTVQGLAHMSAQNPASSLIFSSSSIHGSLRSECPGVSSSSTWESEGG